MRAVTNRLTQVADNTLNQAETADQSLALYASGVLPIKRPSTSHISRSRIFDLAMKTVVLLRRAGISKHHHRIPRSRHQVVVLFDNLPVLAVIETKLVPPIV